MNHIKSYRLFEAVATQELTFTPYFDKLLIDDENKVNSLLDRGPNTWSSAEREYMGRMSRKNVPLWIGSDKNIYTQEELEEMGYDVNKLSKPKSRDRNFEPDIKNLVKKYQEALNLSKEILNKYNEEYDMTKIVKPISKTLDSAVYDLSKL